MSQESRKSLDSYILNQHAANHDLEFQNTPHQVEAVNQSLIKNRKLVELRTLLDVFDSQYSTFDRERIIILREIKSIESEIREILLNA